MYPVIKFFAYPVAAACKAYGSIKCRKLFGTFLNYLSINNYHYHYHYYYYYYY